MDSIVNDESMLGELNSNQGKIDYKTIRRTALGAFLEWYEFSIFMYVTPMISAAFFPSDNKLIALLWSFGIFAAGYLMRPLGGLIFGSFGDRF